MTKSKFKPFKEVGGPVAALHEVHKRAEHLSWALITFKLAYERDRENVPEGLKEALERLHEAADVFVSDE